MRAYQVLAFCLITTLACSPAAQKPAGAPGRTAAAGPSAPHAAGVPGDAATSTPYLLHSRNAVPVRPTMEETSSGPVVHRAGTEAPRFGSDHQPRREKVEDWAKMDWEQLTDPDVRPRLAAEYADVGGESGQRDAEDEGPDFGGVRLMLGITPVVAEIGSFERYPSIRLNRAPGGPAVRVGIALRFGGSRTSLPPPRASAGSQLDSTKAPQGR